MGLSKNHLLILIRTLLMLFLFSSTGAWAYPELTRYGYPNCTACHVSPTGGSVLTPYGRENSRNVLSTWGSEGEERPAYFIDQPEWLNLGGDYRSVYTYQDTPQIEQGMIQFMELDVAAAAQYKNWTLEARVGYQDPGLTTNGGAKATDYLLSKEHYLMYHFTDEIAVRGGRFYPDFGLQTPNHSILIKDQLNIRQPEQLGYGESYNLEASYLGDEYNVVATGILGRPDDPSSAQREVGFSLVGSRAFSDSYKAGVSLMYGTDDIHRREVVGPFAILGFTRHLYLLTELDFQNYTPKSSAGTGPSAWGFAQTNRFGYQITKGLDFVVDQEYARTQFSLLTSLRQRYGAGLWWYPRPHFELAIEYQQRQDRSQPFSDFYDYAYFLWHYYL